MGVGIAYVVHPELRFSPSKRPAEQMLAEVALLAEAIGLEIGHAEIISLSKVRAGAFFGTGVTTRIGKLVSDYDDPIVIINTALSPVQQRNLEMAIGAKVIDRTQLILEIFGARAQTHAGRLQVELAAFSFQRSRLVRSWTHLERQRGGGGFLGGPGERQIELDRRMLVRRVTQIKMELKDVERTRTLQRQNRVRGETPTIALIGYTNAGKSTLFNHLTGARVLSKDMLFATLDPTMREVTLPSGRRAILADTVGFISQLPTELIEAFKSTLEEVVHADLLLHVHDASSQFVSEDADDVVTILNDLGLDELRQQQCVIHIFNKSDLIGENDQRLWLGKKYKGGLFTSATASTGIVDLLHAIDEYLAQDSVQAVVEIKPEDGAARAWLYAHAHVRDSRFDDGGCETLTISISHADNARFHARWPHLG
ncbi:MAG: GTPase HflX [Flavobacteriaceae bacterium]|nr:GTPase HflX [Flavobacteriaceae bacterium]